MSRIIALVNCSAFAACFLWKVVPQMRDWNDVRGLVGYLRLCGGILAVGMGVVK